MPENLTKEQDLAIKLKRHISVKANAGSGKTKVLVDRYIRILEDSYTKTDIAKTTPYEIVAMTFTRKAAGEMLKKVVEKIEELKTINPSANSIKSDIYTKIRNDIYAARISTIHSFASSLLRDFAIEANVNPNFIELTDSNRHRIKNEAFEYVITMIYQDSAHNLHKPLLSFINRYTIKVLENYTSILANSKENMLSFKKSDFYSISKEEILEKYNPLFLELLNAKLKEFFHFTKLAFDYTSDNDKPEYLSKRDSFSSIVNAHQSNTNFCYDDLKNYFYELSLIYTGKPAVFLRKGLPTYFSESCSEIFHFEYAKVKDKIEKNYLLDYDDLVNSTLIQIQDAKFLFEFTEQILKKTEDEKQKFGFLDYDDILIKTDQLLSNPEVAQKISSKIKYMMVDEFQDTNPTQYSIIKKLIPGLFDNKFTYPTSPEVFIVGDEKQSIYGFRGSDVSIIKEATKFIENHQQIREEDYLLRKLFPNTTPAELSGNIELNASFRMKPALAHFTNSVFSKLMAPATSSNKEQVASNEKYRATYSNIICGKSNVKDSEPYHQILLNINSNMMSNGSNDFGTVEFLFSENEYEYETRAVSDSIIKLLETNKYQAKDICILCRDKVHIKELTIELSNREIPFFTHTGTGFYQTVEVRDVLSILSFLSDTKNDFELVSALKSPFFGLRDSDLLILSNYETEIANSSLWEKLQDYCKIEYLNDDTQKRLAAATNQINYLLRISFRMSIPKLIRTLLKETGWMSKITPFKDKDQRIANIYKLIDSAREFEKQGFLTIYDFVNELETLEEISKDAEAGLNNQNAVNIMTIHSAKGLEFPVVYLYDTNRDLLSKANKSSFSMDSNLGITFKNSKLINKRFFGMVDNIPVILAKHKNKEISIYEEIRLLYVAITRAIDKLYVSASIIEFDTKTDEIKYNLEKQSYINMLINSIPNFPEAADLSESAFLLKHSNLQFLVENKIEIVNDINLAIDYSVLTHKNESLIDSDKVISVTEPNKHYYSNIDLDNVLGHERDIFFSASKLSTFKKDRKRFWLEYILEMDDFLLKKSLDKFNTKDSSGLLGQETGTAIHGVFEKMNRWYDFDNCMIKADEFQLVLNEALSLVDKVGNSDIIHRITSEVNNVMATQLIQSKEFDFSTMKNEFALRYSFGRDFLSGVIDLLIKDTNGNYEIWDFKSDYLAKDGIISKAHNYEEQIKLYAYLIYLLNDKPETIKARLLFTRLALPNAKNEEWTHLFSWSAEEMEEYKIELEERIQEIYNEYEL